MNTNLLRRRMIPYDMGGEDKFIADNIPDVRYLFLLQGKRYICENLSATFTENGMSQIINGIFYQVKD